MLSDEQILQKATLLLEQISKNVDLTTEVLLREVSDAEMKGVEAILQKLADNPRGALAFDISPRMLECMPGETSDGDGLLGYCWMHHFKCHSARSCRTWAKGGPITEDSVSADWQERSNIDKEE